MKFKRLVAMSAAFLIAGSTVPVLADSATNVNGNWYSNYETDFNGVSQVGTKYLSDPAVYCTLTVVNGSGGTIGTKKVAVGTNQTVEHTCWGQPFLARRGKVLIAGKHNPWFNA